MAPAVRQKPVDQLKGHRKVPGREKPGGLVVLQAPDQPQIPPSPRVLHERAQLTWDRYWRSPLPQIVDLDSDMPVLERWILSVHEWWTLKADFDDEPITAGSRGQLRANPLEKRIASLEAEIRRFEDDFGMTPKARMRLGIAFAGPPTGGLSGLIPEDDAEDEDEWVQAP